ncbi:MAG: hypothetical protein H6672_13370 [Anaerolineaceae bacterium]|nr:hypothetical protein [Anaerolineaceae bacterium]
MVFSRCHTQNGGLARRGWLEIPTILSGSQTALAHRLVPITYRHPGVPSFRIQRSSIPGWRDRR